LYISQRHEICASILTSSITISMNNTIHLLYHPDVALSYRLEIQCQVIQHYCVASSSDDMPVASYITLGKQLMRMVPNGRNNKAIHVSVRFSNHCSDFRYLKAPNMDGVGRCTSCGA